MPGVLFQYSVGCPVQAPLGRECSLVTARTGHSQLRFPPASGTQAFPPIPPTSFLDLQLLSAPGKFGNLSDSSSPYCRKYPPKQSLDGAPSRVILEAKLGQPPQNARAGHPPNFFISGN